jgi:hypothetical protein
MSDEDLEREIIALDQARAAAQGKTAQLNGAG